MTSRRARDVDASELEEVPRPRVRPVRVDVSEHHRRRRRYPDRVRGRHDAQPLLGRQLVRAYLRAHVVVENLRGGARERA
eukprot:30898-Pelagococcus_subviridis.AAC.16